MTDDRKDKGENLRRSLFGDTPLPPHASERIRRHTNDHLFGDVWQNEDLSPQEHSLITCAVLVATDRPEQQRAHFAGARNLGIPRAKMEAMIEHVMHYAGWPVGMTAARVLSEVWPAGQAGD